MKALRLGYALGLLAFVAGPLLVPFHEVIDPGAWSWSQDDLERLSLLACNTLVLCGSVVAVALPVGVLLAVLLFRTSFFARRFFILILIVMLFVPLPVIVSAWQAMLGADGWLPLEWWRGAQARPWATGMLAAIWIHLSAALPWVTLIVGVGLTWVEPEREEEAAQQVGPWSVLVLVTLPRVRASILAAGLFIALQTAGEISVTDMLLVRTLAREMHDQFTLGQHHALARTLVVFLPLLLTTWLAVLVALWRVERTLPPLLASSRLPNPLDVGTPWLRWIGGAALVLLVCLPLIGLPWKLGLQGYPPRWDGATAERFLRAECILFGVNLPKTIGTGLIAGALTAWLGLVGCWLARESSWFRILFFSVLTWAWVLPAPVVGIAVHDVIRGLAQRWPGNPLIALCYHGPSPLPLVWVQVIRALPIAALFLWPIVRLIPRELFEDARLAGVDAIGEWRYIIWPMTARATLTTAFVAAALCLGEVGASVRVETPGWSSFTLMLFERMHYGVENSLSALSLLMLASVGGVVLAASIMRTVWQWARRS